MIHGLNEVMKRQEQESRLKSARQSSFVTKNRENWQLGAPSWANLEGGVTIPTIVAVGGGKGGVGKSLISANIGAQMANEGKRVLIIDMDLGSANLHTYFGFPRPKKSLSDFLSDDSLSFKDLFLQGPMNGLSVISGGRMDERSLSQKMGPRFFTRFWRELALCYSLYHFDFVLIDLGAGTHRLTVELFSLAHVGVVTILPEPTSIENAYVFLRAYLWRLIENLGYHSNRAHEASQVCDLLAEVSADSVDGGYLAALKEQYRNYPEFIRDLGQVVLSRRTGFLVNQVRSRDDEVISGSMESICRRFFGLQAHALGYLNYDDAAWKSLRNQRLLLLDFPHSLIVQRLGHAARNLLTLCR